MIGWIRRGLAVRFHAITHAPPLFKGAPMGYAEMFGTSEHEAVLRARVLMPCLYAEAVRCMREVASGASTPVSVKDWLSNDAFEVALQNGRSARFTRERGVIRLVYAGFPHFNQPLGSEPACEPGERPEAGAKRWMENVMRNLTAH